MRRVLERWLQINQWRLAARVWLIIISNPDRRSPHAVVDKEATTCTAHDGTRFGLARTRVGDEFMWFESWPYGHRSSTPPRAFCSSSLAPLVAMMQSTHSRKGDDLCALRGPLRDRPTLRSLLGETEVGAIFVMVGDVVAYESNCVAAAEHDDVIEQLSPTATYPSLGD